MKKIIFLILITLITLATTIFIFLYSYNVSLVEDEINLPNRNFTEIEYYNDHLSDSKGMRAFPWGIEIWGETEEGEAKKPEAYFKNNEAVLIGYDEKHAIVLTIPDPVDKPKVKPNTFYTQSFEVKLENVTGKVRLIHQWFNSDDPLLHQMIRSDYGPEIEKENSGWHTISLTRKSPIGAKKGDIILELIGSGTVYIRNPRYHSATFLEILLNLDKRSFFLWCIAVILTILILMEFLAFVSFIPKRKLIFWLLIIAITFALSIQSHSVSKEIKETEKEIKETQYDYYEPFDTLLKNQLHRILPFRGIDFFPRPYSYNSESAIKELEILLSFPNPEINWIQLRFFLSQDNLQSNEVTYDKTQISALSLIIKNIHDAGKKVSLMPQLYTRSQGYVANLNPTDRNKWFESYTLALKDFAILAEQEKVEMFSIANEMTNVVTDPENNQKWNELIDLIRSYYKGKLTLKLNCWYKEEQFESVLNASWLEKLDYLGIAAYFDLTNKMDPTEEELQQAWYNNRHGINIVNHLEILSKKYNKPIIFSEIGYRNIDGSNIEPWNSDAIPPKSLSVGTGKIDHNEAIMCTKVMFDVFKAKQFWEGCFFFAWPTAPTTTNDISYSIKDKPVCTILLEEYRRGR